MRITYSGIKTVVRDNFIDYAEKRMAKLEKFFNDEPTAKIKVENDQDREIVEVVINGNGLTYRAKATTKDRTESLNSVCDTLALQITKDKDKFASQKRQKKSIKELTNDTEE